MVPPKPKGGVDEESTEAFSQTEAVIDRRLDYAGVALLNRLRRPRTPRVSWSAAMADKDVVGLSQQ